MDGAHDLGGKEGFGPIDVNEEDVPFHAEWEGRMWGISRCSGAPDWTIDWWRHVRELIDPVDYLSRPYYDSWAQTDIAAHINSGTFTLEEVIAAKSANSAPTVPPDQPISKVTTREDAVAAEAVGATRYDRPMDQPPAFKVGDPVRASLFGHDHHTRLPAYARGKCGRIHAHHGAHVLADENARGREVAQHIYSVVFTAGDLWGEEAGRNDRIYLDLWESYLDPA